MSIFTKHKNIDSRQILLWALMLFCVGIIFSGCNKDKKDEPVITKEYDVYVAGTYNPGSFGFGIGRVWKNGEIITDLKESNGDAVQVGGIFVNSKGDVYVAGSTGYFRKPTPCYWVNGVKKVLSSAPKESTATIIFEDAAGTVFIGGGAYTPDLEYYIWLWDSKSSKSIDIPQYVPTGCYTASGDYILEMLTQPGVMTKSWWSVAGGKMIARPAGVVSLGDGRLGDTLLTSSGAAISAEYKGKNDSSNEVNVWNKAAMLFTIKNADTGFMYINALAAKDNFVALTGQVYRQGVGNVPYYWIGSERRTLRTTSNNESPSAIFIKTR